MFLKIVLVYLLIGCIISIVLLAGGNVKGGWDQQHAKGCIHYINLIIVVVIVPILLLVTLFTSIFKNQPPKL